MHRRGIGDYKSTKKLWEEEADTELDLSYLDDPVEDLKDK